MRARWSRLWLMASLVLAAGEALAQDAGEEDGGSSGDAARPNDGSSSGDAARPNDGGSSDTSPQAMAGHIMVEATSSAVRVTEVYVLVLTEPLAAPSEAGAPWLSLPEGATTVEVERGEELFRPVEGGIALVGPAEPGRHTLAFSFILPAEEGRTVVDHRLPFAVGSLHVMWPADAPYAAQAMGFTDRGELQMGPRQVRLLERESLLVGERLIIVTLGQPSPPQAEAVRAEARDPLSAAFPVTLLIAALFLLLGAILPYSLRRG